MTEPSQLLLEKLRLLNLVLRLRLEQAEARVPGINDLIQQLSIIERCLETALLGLVIFEKHYSIPTELHDSSQILQAAILVPGGLGVILWDSEEYLTFRKHPPTSQGELLLKFVPFDRCESGVKKLLLPQVEPLMELLMQRFGS